MEKNKANQMEIVTREQLQKYSSVFYDSSILTRVNIPKPACNTLIIVLSKIFSIAKGYTMCTICLISEYTKDIVIEAYKIQEDNTIIYNGGIELTHFGEVNIKPGCSYIIYLHENSYIPLLIQDSVQNPSIELIENNSLQLSPTINTLNKKSLIKQIIQIWVIFTILIYCFCQINLYFT